MRESRTCASACAAAASSATATMQCLLMNRMVALSSAARVDDGEAADVCAAVRQRNMEEVDAAADELAVPVTQIPGDLATAGRARVVEHVHQDSGHRVDADRRALRHVHE